MKLTNDVEELCSIIATYELDEEEIYTLIECISNLSSDDEDEDCCKNKYSFSDNLQYKKKIREIKEKLLNKIVLC